MAKPNSQKNKKRFFMFKKKIFKYFLGYWRKKMNLAQKNTHQAVLRLRFRVRAFFCQAVDKLNRKAQKQKYIIKRQNFSLSYKPFFLAQGMAVFVLTICILFAGIFVFLPKPKIADSLLIKSAKIGQVGVAVAGRPVKWAAVVDKKDINGGKYFLELPAAAKNIKIKNLSSLGAKKYLAEIKKSKGGAITISDRNQLAGIFKIDFEGISFKNTNTAGLLEAKEAVFRVFSAVNSFFLADLEDAAGNMAEQITEVAQQASGEIMKTDEAVMIDLSDQAEPMLQTAGQGSNDVIKDDRQVSGNNDNLEKKEFKNKDKESEQIKENKKLTDATESVSPQDQDVIAVTEPGQTAEDVAEEAVLVEYETPPPIITEQNTDAGKLVKISSEDYSGHPQLTDVIAHTNIPEIYKVGQEDKIKIKWKNNGNSDVIFSAYDLDGNGKLDYVEWTVPHLSEQIFEIIFISKAWWLDENLEISEDIYDAVRAKDGVWQAIPENNYVRVTFEEILNSTKDITLYVKPAGSQIPQIEVYPVYTDNAGNYVEGGMVAVFSALDREDTYKVYLANLQQPTDMFDLKIIGGGVDFDYIVDPSISDTFGNETKLGTGTDKVKLSGGQITIQDCYAPNPSWTLVGVSPSTHVRDLSVTANSTTYIDKDIYCDSTNCILWTAGAAAPGTVCIATDASVYANVLWRKADISGTKAWANTANSTITIAGGDIGGTHSTNKAGTGSTSIGTYKWLARYYTSANGTAPYYPAMDACKGLGLGWRLPTILELDSIRDQTASNGAYTRLPGIVAGYYWSSTEYSSTNAWRLGFNDGNVNSGTKTGGYYVRCVRGY